MTTGELTYHMTNVCDCESEGDDFDFATCYGCWDDYVEDFREATDELVRANETGWWRVRGLRLWDGEHGGYFRAETTLDLIRGLAVDSAWTMRYAVRDGAIHYSLSHHDAPMGSNSVAEPVSQETVDALGLC